MEETNVQTTEKGTTEQAATAPATQTTPPQAATVDVEAITQAAATKAEEAAQKKMEGVFKSMLQQQGMDADTIAKMTEDWKAKQVTPESQLKELQDQLASERAASEAKDKRFAAIAKGVPADKADKYVKLADAFADDKTDFAAALDLALVEFPVKTTVPQFVAPSGGGGEAVNMDEFQKRIDKYKRR